MKNNSKSERGQALILIVFGMIALIGMTALAVDGGNAYSDRRHAQNAADTAAFAAGRAYIRAEGWKAAALAIASQNGYEDTDSTAGTTAPNSNVEVYRCDEAASSCGSTYAGSTQYLQVKIDSIVDTYFGPVVGIDQVENRVSTIVRVVPGTVQPLGNGNAVWTLSEHACAAIQYTGGADVEIISSPGSGVYLNSDCPTNAFQNSSNSGSFTTPCLSAVGGVVLNSNVVHINPPTCKYTGVAPLPYPQLPNLDDCGSGAAVKTGNTLSPGNWTGAFPPGGVTNLQSGLYCVYAGNQGFDLHAADSLTGSNVSIFLITGGLTWNGQADIHLDAPDSGAYKGLLIYAPPTNSEALNINGGGSSSIVGSILAPSSECIVNGGGSQSAPLETQLACDTVKFSGNSGTVIKYDPDLSYAPPVAPALQLIK